MSTLVLNACPVTGKPGTRGRVWTGADLVRCYQEYTGVPLPQELVDKYFQHTVEEWTCAESGVRWYTPAVVGEGDFYEHLGKTYAWYYAEERWDLQFALALTKKLEAYPLVDVGCGSGRFVARAVSSGIPAMGTDINRDGVEQGRREGLQLFLPEEFPREALKPKMATLLQIVEHVPDPVGFVRAQIKLLQPEYLIVAAPNYQGYLGYARDPLSWPPHHVSAWSPTGFASLASATGCELVEVHCEPLRPIDYISRRFNEKEQRFTSGANLPRHPFQGKLGRLADRAMLEVLQAFKVPAFSHGNSVLGLFRCHRS